MSLLEELKGCFAKKYNTNDLEEIKMIIEWQISKDTVLGTMKIDQSTFIRDMVIKKRLIKYKPNVVPMKANFTIDKSKVKDYKETNLQVYQRFISKLMYLVYGTRSDITFVVRQFSKHNADARKIHL